MWIFCTDKTFSDTILTRRKISSCFFWADFRRCCKGEVYDKVYDFFPMS